MINDDSTMVHALQVTAQGDLISTEEPTANGPSRAPESQTSDAVADLLSMDLGGGGGAGLGASGAASSTAAADLLDLLGGADLNAPSAPVSTSNSNVADLLGDSQSQPPLQVRAGLGKLVLQPPPPPPPPPTLHISLLGGADLNAPSAPVSSSNSNIADLLSESQSQPPLQVRDGPA